MQGVTPRPAAKPGHPSSPGVCMPAGGFGPVLAGGPLGEEARTGTHSLVRKGVLSFGLAYPLGPPSSCSVKNLEARGRAGQACKHGPGRGSVWPGSEGGAVLSFRWDAPCLAVYLDLLTPLVRSVPMSSKKRAALGACGRGGPLSHRPDAHRLGTSRTLD